MDQASLVGHTVIVTGSNSGIGKETARELARRGARVILACRSEQKAEEAKKEIVNDTGNEDVVVKILDLSSLESIKRFADDIRQNESRLDILVNNAAVWTRFREQTIDGFEMNFGVNHLGHFYLTNLLLEKLKASAPSRIVTVSGKLYENYPLDFNDIQTVHGWSNVKGYSRTKTANILFSTYLAKLLEGTGVTTYSLHPGVFASDLLRNVRDTAFIKFVVYCGSCIGLRRIAVSEGARTTLYCCLEPKLANESGLYYSDQRQSRAKRFATDPVLAEQLWKISKDLCKL